MAGRGSKPGERRGGRKKGTPNKATAAAREAFARFVDGNAGRLQGWLDQIANGVRDPKNKRKFLTPPNPQKAFELFASVAEFHVPKLARTELSGPGGGPIPTAQVTKEVTDQDSMRTYLSMITKSIPPP